MEVAFGIILFSVFIYCVYQSIKSAKAEKALDDIYKRRDEEDRRRMRLIAEKPDWVIFQSELMDLNPGQPFTFIGEFDSFDNIKAKSWDIAFIEGHEHLFKDGKWFEIVDDISHIERILKAS